MSPTLIMIGWLAVGAIDSLNTGKLSDVAKNDESSLLSASAEATEVSALRQRFADSETTPAIVVAERPGGVTQKDRQLRDGVNGEADGQADVRVASPVIPSTDGETLRLVVPTAASGDP